MDVAPVVLLVTHGPEGNETVAAADGLAGACLDITVGKQLTEAALRESREETQLALDSAKLGVWRWAIDTEEFWASAQTFALFGWPPNSRVDHGTLLNSVHPDDRENVGRLLEKAKREPSECAVEFRAVLPDGSLRWINCLGRSYEVPQGTPAQVLGVFRDITDQKRNEKALTDLLAFETLLAELSAMFINLPANQVDGQIQEAQRRICEALGLDRSTLAQIQNGNVILTHSWAREGFEPVPPISTKENLPWYARMLLGGHRLSFSRIDDLPEEAAIDKESFLKYGSKSNLTFPLSAGGEVIGALAFATLREERTWPEPLVDRLGLMAQVFANALARARDEEKLQKAYREIEQLKGQLEQENVYLRREVELEHSHHGLIGKGNAMRSVLKKVEQVATTDATVLLLGETGTGKELIARTVHEHSRRKNRVMVKVNCAALPANLVESELFGREKGAYTGAVTREIGRFELANGSTIFLDEIGELPLELQSKLLRVLQEGEFERLGSPKTITVNVRVIAATGRNLRESVREGKFREDLFYRLNVFPITIPPLRERREDIPALVWHFVSELGQRMGRSIETISGPTMEAFKSYSWPGNIRELRNVIERFLITSTGTVLQGDLPAAENGTAGVHSTTFEDIQRNHILQILRSVGWRVRGEGGAARILAMKPTTLESRMQKLGIIRSK